MKFSELLQQDIVKQAIKEFWVIDFYFKNKPDFSVEISSCHRGFSYEQIQHVDGCFSFPKYYSRYGNLLKAIKEKDLEVSEIKVGCDGRKYYQTFKTENFVEEIKNEISNQHI